jgi:hypothetical protein
MSKSCCVGFFNQEHMQTTTTHSLSQTHNGSLLSDRTHMLIYTHTITLSPLHSLSQTDTHTHIHTTTHTLTITLSLTQTHIHTTTHTHDYSLSLTHTHTHTPYMQNRRQGISSLFKEESANGHKKRHS